MKIPLLPLAFVLALPAAAQCPHWAEGLQVPGFDQSVETLAVFDPGGGPQLYAGGSFGVADGAPAHFLARLEGPTWREVGGGLDGYVTALTVFDDGSGPALYVGGNFVTAGGVACTRVARFDGTSFTPLGAGFDAPVLALRGYDDGTGARLFAGGSFTSSGATACAGLACFHGTSWSGVAGGVDGAVEALEVFQNELVVGGSFTHAGPLATTGVACWNGSAWSSLGALTAAVRALAVFDAGVGGGPKLYAGGDFGMAPGPVHVARWNGASWESPGASIASPVFALHATVDVHGPALYVGGSAFTSSMLRLDGNGASAFQPPQAYGPVKAFASLDRGGVPSVVIGGQFQLVTLEGDVGVFGAGPDWEPLGSGHPLAGIHDAMLHVASGPLAGTYLAGKGLWAEGRSMGALARWNGASWEPAGLASFTRCTAIARADLGAGERLFVAVTETVAPTRGVWAWDGAQWTQVGVADVPSASSTVLDLAAYDAGSGPELYAVGSFTAISGVAAKNIARWNGTTWSALGLGLDQRGDTLRVFDPGTGPRLYVRGDFATASGIPAGTIASWDGTSFAPVGGGIGSSGETWRTMVVFDDGGGAKLYASSSHPGLPGVQAWDGSSWSVVGTLTTGVRGLAVFDDGTGGGPSLYALADPGGGSGVLPGLLRWNGSAWVNVLRLTMGDPAGRRWASAVEANALWVGSIGGLPGQPAQWIGRYDGCSPVSSFCAGDGVDAHVTTSCPCGNAGGVGRGCAWSGGAMGALLEASGDVASDQLVLTASGMSAAAPSTIFLKGDALIPQGVVFGDGVRCVGGSLIRLGAKTNVAGSAQYPEAGNASIATRGMTPIGSGSIGYYQTYFRNAASFCTSATFNVTNGVRVVW